MDDYTCTGCSYFSVSLNLFFFFFFFFVPVCFGPLLMDNL